MGEQTTTVNVPIILILGGPGCGKGTLCEQIGVKHNFTHLSTGELLRACVMSGTDRGLQLFGIMERGQHVPDEEVVSLLSEAIQSKVGGTMGFLIDGFPASVQQAKMFEEKIVPPTKIIHLDVNEDIMKGRLRQRGNFDDKEDAIVKRIQLYKEKTKPVLEAYSKSVKKINGEKKVDEIYLDVCKYLELV